MLKFTSNKDKKRPVSESKVARTRRRSQLMDVLATKFEKSPTKMTNEEISHILKESKMINLPEDAVKPFLETRSNIAPNDVDEDAGDAQVTYTMTPIYPEQIYYNKVRVNAEELEKQAKTRTQKFGACMWSNLESSELTVSVSPVQNKQGKKLISQSSIGNNIKKGVFLDKTDTEGLLRQRDNQFVDRMRDTQGNAIQKMKHAFLNQDDRVLRKKLLDALRKKFSKMIVKDKTVEELRKIYEQKPESDKKVKDWMALARSTHRDDSNQKPISQIGKINLNMEQR